MSVIPLLESFTVKTPMTPDAAQEAVSRKIELSSHLVWSALTAMVNVPLAAADLIRTDEPENFLSRTPSS